MASRISQPKHSDQSPGRSDSRQLWPAGSRGVLGALGVAAALGMALASDSCWPLRSPSEFVAPVLVLDPNTAPPQVLSALPHIGPALVDRFIAARADRPFSSMDDAAKRVRGLGPVGLARIAPHLRLKTGVEFSGESLAMTLGTRPARKSRSPRRKTVRTQEVSASIPPAPQLVALDVDRGGR